MKLLQKITSLAVTATMIMGLGSNLMASPKNVKIDAKHFPDENFRTYISNNFDLNHNGTLSISEIESALSINIDREDDIKSFEGIKYLEFIKEMDVGYIELDDPIVDLSENFNLTRIRFINVKGMTSLTPGILTGSLEIDYCEDLKTINLEDTYYLSKLWLIENQKLKGDIDASGCPYLKDLFIMGKIVEGKHPIDNIYVNKKTNLPLYCDEINGKIIKK